MKKILTMVLVALFAVGLTACKDNKPSDAKKDSQKTESGFPETELPFVPYD